MDVIVNLNIGGKIFATTKETLLQNIEGNDSNFFIKLLNKEQPSLDEKGYYFIDRDYTNFRYILNYLRNFGDLRKCVFPFQDEMKIKEIQKEAEFYELNQLVKYIKERHPLFMESYILNHEMAEKISQLFEYKKKWKLIYRASIDGVNPGDFHNCCDLKGPLLIFSLSNKGHFIGGFTSKSWRSNGQFVDDLSSYLFLFEEGELLKYPMDESKHNSLHYSLDSHIHFGLSDFMIQDNEIFVKIPQTFKGDKIFNYQEEVYDIEVFIESK